jgi:hypothetical protein
LNYLIVSILFNLITLSGDSTPVEYDLLQFLIDVASSRNSRTSSCGIPSLKNFSVSFLRYEILYFAAETVIFIKKETRAGFELTTRYIK